MKHICIFFILFQIGLAYSCGGQQSEDYDLISNQIKNHTGVLIPKFSNFNYESSTSLGDYAESFVIKFDTINFQILVERILASENFCNKVTPITSGNVNAPTPTIWKRYESGYKYELFFPEKHEQLAYYVNISNHTLHYIYIKE